MEQLSPLEQLTGHALQGILSNPDNTLLIENEPQKIYAKAVAAAKGVQAELQKEQNKTKAQ